MLKRILKFIELVFPKGRCALCYLYPERYYSIKSELFNVRYSFCYGDYIINNQHALLMVEKSFLGVGYNDKELPAYGYIQSIKSKKHLIECQLGII